MTSIYDVALEACDEAGEARTLEDALRGIAALDHAAIHPDYAAALEGVLIEAMADRLHAMADRLNALHERAHRLKDEGEI